MFSLLFLVTLLSLCCDHTASVIYNGFIIDLLCWNQENHVGFDGAVLDTNPEDHTVHCLRLSICEASGYALVVLDTDGITYRKELDFDTASNSMVVDFLAPLAEWSDTVYVRVDTSDNGDGTHALADIAMETWPPVASCGPGTIPSTLKLSAMSNIETLEAGDWFGWDIAALGDVDGDDVSDLVVGAPGELDAFNDNKGSVFILFMSSAGDVIGQSKISAQLPNINATEAQYLGSAVEPLGDWDGDFIVDVAIGAVLDREMAGVSTCCEGTGAVFVTMLTDTGDVATYHKINNNNGGFAVAGGELNAFDHFGSAIGFLGDLDGLNAGDIAVGSYFDAEGGYMTGAVWLLFLQNNGGNIVESVTKINKVTLLNNGLESNLIGSLGSFGYSVACAGDFDHDGIASDLVVGGVQQDADTGAVFLVTLDAAGIPLDFKRLETGILGLQPLDWFGSSLALSHTHGTLPLMLVGASAGKSGGVKSGQVYMIRLNSDFTIASYTNRSVHTSILNLDLDTSDAFGSAVAFIDDRDMDGIQDIAVGARQDDEGGFNIGAVYLIPLDLCDCSNTGAYGEYCEFDIDECASSPCVNGATCHDTGYNMLECNCDVGFFNTFCEDTLCVSSPCVNDGTCENGVDIICNCSSGYTGEFCQLDVDDCASSPCFNEGTCIDLGVDLFRCACDNTSFTGSLCETEMINVACQSSPCLNAGTCVGSNSREYSCLCMNGYVGSECGIFDWCASSPCQNGGICHTDATIMCDCPDGYAGSLCGRLETDVMTSSVTSSSSSSSHNDSTVTSSVTSIKQTSPSSSSSTSDSHFCLSSPCQNEGTCMETGYCTACADGFAGDICEYALDPVSVVQVNLVFFMNFTTGDNATAATVTSLDTLQVWLDVTVADAGGVRGQITVVEYTYDSYSIDVIIAIYGVEDGVDADTIAAAVEQSAASRNDVRIESVSNDDSEPDKDEDSDTPIMLIIVIIVVCVMITSAGFASWRHQHAATPTMSKTSHYEMKV